jgi:hypothetical protein
MAVRCPQGARRAPVNPPVNPAVGRKSRPQGGVLRATQETVPAGRKSRPQGGVLRCDGGNACPQGADHARRAEFAVRRRNACLRCDGRLRRPACGGRRPACETRVNFQLGMRESGYSLSPLYLKPLLIVGKFVRLSVCLSVRLLAVSRLGQILDLHYIRFLYIYVNL